MNLLLVDSVEPYRVMIAEKFIEADFCVEQAGTAHEARIIMERAEFDIVVIDNQLPDKSGFELLEDLGAICADAKMILIMGPFDNDDTFAVSSTLENRPLIVRGPLHPDNIVNEVNILLNGKNAKSEDVDAVDDPFLDSVAPGKEDPAKLHSKEMVAQQLTVVRRSYQDRLPIELRQLKTSLDEAKKSPENDDAWNTISHLTHTLHGTAGTLGFFEVSDAARDIGALAKQLRKGNVDTEPLWKNIYTALRKAVTVPDRFSLIPDEALSSHNAMTFTSIMVVDEDKQMLAEIEAMGYEHLLNIVTANSREQALEKALACDISGVVIDLGFREVENAFDLAHELRALDNMENLPVAFMSSDSSVHNRIAVASAGASHFLEKPISADALEELGQIFISERSGITPKVLVVDDDEFFRKHLLGVLESEGMETGELESGEQVLDMLDQFKPDLMLLDVNMPDISGYDVCKMIRSVSIWKNLPILFLTAESIPEARIQCFEAGGDDYIEKPVIKEELMARIGVRLERIRLFNERANKDQLTSLLNRRAFLEQFKTHLAEGDRFMRNMSFCMIDLDHFKHVNDTYGHLTGDQVLSGLGRLLAGRFRNVDLRGRWGGEEFAVSIYGENAKTSKMIISRVLETLRSMTFEGESGEKFHVTFSAGIATYPTDGKTFDELFRAADRRLYEAKEQGRNRISA